MIHSRLNDLLRIVLNEADGEFSIEEFREASEQTLALTAQGYGVIWDFRKLRLSHCDPDILNAIKESFSARPAEPVPQKRALLVGAMEDRDILDDFLGSASINWPWGVFLDFGKALQWLED